jgi:hypothetical protein
VLPRRDRSSGGPANKASAREPPQPGALDDVRKSELARGTQWAEGYTLTKPEGLMAHFTSAATAFDHILMPGGKLRLGRYGRMQDPAENKDVVPNFEVPSEPPDAQQRVEAAFRAHRDRMLVLCLTRDADVRAQESPQFDCCWARPRMWEQYGDRHRGVCLLFDAARLEHAISEAYPEHAIYKGTVTYSREGIARSCVQRIVVVSSVADEDLTRVVSEYTDTHHDALFFLKKQRFCDRVRVSDRCRGRTQ